MSTLSLFDGPMDASVGAEGDPDAMNELETLRVQIEHHERLYRAGVPEIPDAAFDELLERYQELADRLEIDPAVRVDATPGADHTEGFETLPHRMPMLSLEKLSPNRKDSQGESIPYEEQLAAWYLRRRKELELGEDTPLPLLVEPKIDGISVSLLYERGLLTRALTRGDGKSGDVITAQVMASGSVPLRLGDPFAAGTLEVRGELYWPRAEFDAYNEAQRAAGEKVIANPSQRLRRHDEAQRSEGARGYWDPRFPLSDPLGRRDRPAGHAEWDLARARRRGRGCVPGRDPPRR